MAKKRYSVPVSWVMLTYMDVEADSLKEAVELIYHRWDNMDVDEFPPGAEYAHDSFEVYPEAAYVRLPDGKEVEVEGEDSKWAIEQLNRDR